jgi:hypothetical protein
MKHDYLRAQIGIISACPADLAQGGQFGGKVFAKVFATLFPGGKHLWQT